MKFTLIPENEKHSHPLTVGYRNNHGGEDFIHLDTGYDLIVLHEDFNIIAAMSYCIFPDDISIVELRVKEEFQRQGYGTEIMKYIFEMAKNQRKRVELVCRTENTIGRNFFTKLHFKQIKNQIRYYITCDEIVRYF
jgi:ribosomal protein S18 acetylase RimI-like enzyme